MPNGHPDKPSVISNLGIGLQSRFERLGSLIDMDDMISNQRKAVELTPDGHPEKPRLFSHLGNALQLRFGRLSNFTDVEEAISNLRRAVELTPDGHPDKSGRLSNLGTALRSRFERLGNLIDMDAAISSLQQAVELTPDGHPDEPGQLKNLGYAFITRFNCLGLLSDLEDGLSTLSTAANSASGSAMERFRAARLWAETAERYSRTPLDAFRYAIELLPRVAWLGLAMADQHALLAEVGGVVRDAVAAAIRYEEYETAVVWAEQGRSIGWQNLLGLRNPIDELHTSHPQLADRLQSIARQLEASESHDTIRKDVQMVSVENISRKYSKLAVEWENVVEEVRRIPQFEGFLRAKSFRQLAPTAYEGPVAILNVSDSRCDALVLISDDSDERHVSVVNIALERFSYEKSKKLFHILTSLLSSAGVRDRSHRKTGRVRSQADREAKFKGILRILWQDVVKPVIKGLAFQVGLRNRAVLCINVLSAGPIRATSAHLVVRDWVTRVPSHSCCRTVRSARNRGESLGLCRFLIYPDINCHT
jgi:tetratricopeptide (TPR) repeat protein